MTSSIQERLPAKTHRTQAGLPDWVQSHGGQRRAQPHADAFKADLAAHDLASPEVEADAFLALIAGK